MLFRARGSSRMKHLTQSLSTTYISVAPSFSSTQTPRTFSVSSTVVSLKEGPFSLFSFPFSSCSLLSSLSSSLIEFSSSSELASTIFYSDLFLRLTLSTTSCLLTTNDCFRASLFEFLSSLLTSLVIGFFSTGCCSASFDRSSWILVTLTGLLCCLYGLRGFRCGF